MRDDSRRWPPTFRAAPGIDLGAADLKRAQPKRQTLISGSHVLKQMDVPVIEWPAIAQSDSYALSLRRDRVLLVNGPERREGWDETQKHAVSDASDAFAVFDLTGPGAMALLQRGADVSQTVASPSVARMFFGLNVLLYRGAPADHYRIHVPAAQQDALINHLSSVARA